MTQADKHFIDTCKKIITEGYSSEGTGVRTRWEDGSEANYFSIVGVTNVYDVGKEFPMITLRNNSQTVKRAIDEILWIWQKKSNNIKDLNSHIWDQWADENGTIGKAYGYQLGKKYQFKTKEGIKEMDQVDYVLYLLKNDPASRRIMTNIFNHEELKDMRLEPCAYGTQWLVKGGKLKSKITRYVSSKRLEYNAVCSTFMYVCSSCRVRSRNSYTQHRRLPYL